MSLTDSSHSQCLEHSLDMDESLPYSSWDILASYPSQSLNSVSSILGVLQVPHELP